MGEKKTTKKPEEVESRYKALLELDKNLWTFGSPIIIQHGVLERDQISKKNRLTLKFTNIYEQTIRDVYLTVIAKDPEGNVSEIEHAYKALSQNYLSTKGVAKLTIENEEAREFTVRIDQIIFEDGRVFDKKDAVLESVGEIEDLEAFSQDKLKEYEEAYKAGIEAVDSDNADEIKEGIKILEKVHWYMDADEILDESYKKYEAAKQNEDRKQAREDSKASRAVLVKKRGKIAVGVAIAVVVLAVLAVIAYFIPNGKYQSVCREMNKVSNIKLDKTNQAKLRSQYQKLAGDFSSLGGFSHSEDKAAECYYYMALIDLNNNDEVHAKENFQKSYDAAANSEYGKISGSFMDYYNGLAALEDNKIDEAYKCFKRSVDAASDINLSNKASAGFAKVSYMKGNYEDAWDAIKNVFPKDPKSFAKDYGEIGYGYAKYLIGKKKYKEGIKIYNQIGKYTNQANLNESIYQLAVKEGEKGMIANAMQYLEYIKDDYRKAAVLHNNMYEFDQKVKGWLGLWKHHGKEKGKKKTYRIYIKEVLYKGKMCLSIRDKNNKKLGFDTVISRKNHVTQIVVGKYMIKFKLKRYDDQKFTYALKEPNVMIRTWKYGGEKYKTKFKRKVK